MRKRKILSPHYVTMQKYSMYFHQQIFDFDYKGAKNMHNVVPYTNIPFVGRGKIMFLYEFCAVITASISMNTTFSRTNVNLQWVILYYYIDCKYTWMVWSSSKDEEKEQKK